MSWSHQSQDYHDAFCFKVNLCSNKSLQQIQQAQLKRPAQFWTVCPLLWTQVLCGPAACPVIYPVAINEAKSNSPGQFRLAWLAMSNWLPTYLAAELNICCVLFSASECYWSVWAFQLYMSSLAKPQPGCPFPGSVPKSLSRHWSECKGICWHPLAPCAKKIKQITLTTVSLVFANEELTGQRISAQLMMTQSNQIGHHYVII